MELTVQQTVEWITITNTAIQENKEYLTALDQKIGDGDHGINMARGFNEVVGKLSASNYESVADVLKDTAMTLMGKVGGAAGPLYGTAFLKMSMAVKGQVKLDHAGFTKGVEEALAGLKQRGKANEGDKTLVDVWSGVAEKLKSASSFEEVDLAVTAKTAMESTKDSIAKKGRAAYLGERSKGHFDPGSVSSYYLFDSLSQVLKGDK